MLKSTVVPPAARDESEEEESMDIGEDGNASGYYARFVAGALAAADADDEDGDRALSPPTDAASSDGQTSDAGGPAAPRLDWNELHSLVRQDVGGVAALLGELDDASAAWPREKSSPASRVARTSLLSESGIARSPASTGPMRRLTTPQRAAAARRAAVDSSLAATATPSRLRAELGDERGSPGRPVVAPTARSSHLDASLPSYRDVLDCVINKGVERPYIVGGMDLSPKKGTQGTPPREIVYVSDEDAWATVSESFVISTYKRRIDADADADADGDSDAAASGESAAPAVEAAHAGASTAGTTRTIEVAYTDYEAFLAARDEVADSRRVIVDLRHQLAARTDEVTTCVEEIIETRRVLEETHNELASCKAALADALGKSDAQGELLELAEQHRVHAQERLRELEANRAAARDAESTDEASADEAGDDGAEAAVAAAVAATAATVSALESKNAFLNRELDAMRQKLHDAHQEIERVTIVAATEVYQAETSRSAEDELQHRVRQLQAQIGHEREHAQHRMLALSSEIDAMNGMLAAVQERAAERVQAAATAAAVDDQARRHELQVASLEDQLGGLRRELQETRALHAEARQRWEVDAEALRAAREHALDDASQLRVHVAELETLLGEQRQREKDAQSTREAHERHVASLQRDVGAARAQIRVLEQASRVSSENMTVASNRSNETFQRLENRIREQSAELEQAYAQIAELRREAGRESLAVQSSHSDLSFVRAERDAAMDDARQARERRKADAQQIETLREENARLSQQVCLLEVHQDEAQHRNGILQSTLRAKDADATWLRREKKRLEALLADSQAELGKLGSIVRAMTEARG